MTVGSLRGFCATQNPPMNPGHAHRLKQKGRLVMVLQDGKELVDYEASSIRLAETMDPAKHHMMQVNQVQRELHRGAAAAPAAGPAEGININHSSTSTSNNATYMQAKTAREVYEAKKAQLDYEEKSRKLIRLDLVRSVWASKVITLRDSLMQIPARAAPGLAAESDPFTVTELIEAEIRQALQELSAAPAYEKSAGKEG